MTPTNKDAKITMSDIRLVAGEGKLTAHDVLAAANAVLRMRGRPICNGEDSGSSPDGGTTLTTADLWDAIRQRDANINALFATLKVEEKYLLDHFDADCGIMPGDVEGSFHRLRELLRQPTQHSGQTISTDYVLPCDVHLPPATIIRKGCTLTTLMAGIKARETEWPEVTPEQVDAARRLLEPEFAKGNWETVEDESSQHIPGASASNTSTDS